MSDLYLYPCACGEKMSVSISDAGTSVDCNACGKPSTLPGLRDIRKLDPAETTGPSDRSSSAGWTYEKGVWFSLGAGIAFIALIAAAIFFQIAHFQVEDDRPVVQAEWQSLPDEFPQADTLVWGFLRNPDSDKNYRLTKWDAEEEVWYFQDGTTENSDYFGRWGSIENIGVSLEADVQNMDLQTLWQFWAEEVEKAPLAEWEDPVHVINSRYSATFYTFSAVCGGFFLIGTMMVLFSLYRK